jgi:hypothetical protein
VEMPIRRGSILVIGIAWVSFMLDESVYAQTLSAGPLAAESSALNSDPTTWMVSSASGRNDGCGHSCVELGCDGIATGGCCYCCERRHTSRFRLTEFNIYPTFSYLADQSATYNEFEFASHTDLGFLEMENRTVLNVADLPSTIKLGPTNPGDLPTTIGVRGNGFGDILSGFFFSLPGAHERTTHLGVGPVLTFPTASNPILGSEQYTAGPGVHFSTEINRLTAGFFLWQSWGFGEAAGQKKVNQLFGKPFLIYELTEKWNLVYIPLGMSHSWDAPSGDNWTVPVGGGVRRLFEIRGQKMGLQFQAFDYVARKPKDPEWELRATIEFLFD